MIVYNKVHYDDLYIVQIFDIAPLKLDGEAV